MKTLFVALLGAAILAAPVTEALAQAGSSSSSSSDNTPAPGTKPVPAPGAGGSASGSVSTDRSTSSSTVREERRDDGASALPRATVTERTTIFGLSPTAAVLVAAALLLVVILAIVAMTRNGDTYVDQRRL